jgi:aspartate/methionine/tyrosine aminotransferase
MKTISFNTGRGYTEHGQRIGAAQLSDGTVAFSDIDRGIDYVTSGPCALTQTAIMAAYDYNETNGRWYGNDALTDDIKCAIKDAARAVKSAGY